MHTKDELRPVLEHILQADALVMGSPIYWSYPTGMFRNVIERLLFPILRYDKGEQDRRRKSEALLPSPSQWICLCIS